MYVRVGKQSLTTEQQDHVKAQCDGPITLTLLVSVNSSGESDTQGVFTMLAKAVMQLEDISDEQQVEFSNITSQFNHWVKEESESVIPREMVEMRLIVSGGQHCQGTLTPEELGFTDKESAFVIVFSKSDDSEEAIIKAGLAELAAEATASRQKRNQGNGDVVSESADPSNGTLDSFNITYYHNWSCRRYSHTVGHLSICTCYLYHSSHVPSIFCAFF